MKNFALFLFISFILSTYPTIVYCQQLPKETTIQSNEKVENSIFCSKCGQKIEKAAAFCSKCGEKIGPNLIPSSNEYSGQSAIKFLEEKLLFMLYVSMNDFNTELAKIMVEIKKISDLTLVTGTDDSFKPEYTAPAMISLLVFQGILPEIFKVGTGNYSELLPQSPLEAGIIKGLNGGVNNTQYLVALVNDVLLTFKNKQDFFLQFKECRGLGKYLKAKELKEKERGKTKTRHIEFTFSRDIKEFSKIYVWVLGKPNNSKSSPYAEAIIDRADFNGNKVVLKNVGVYGIGLLQLALGLKE